MLPAGARMSAAQSLHCATVTAVAGEGVLEFGAGGYRLGGRRVTDGDQLELHTPWGWARGTFEWSGDPRQWPRLAVPYGEESGQVMLIVLPPGLPCRWPAGTPLEAAVVNG